MRFSLPIFLTALQCCDIAQECEAHLLVLHHLNVIDPNPDGITAAGVEVYLYFVCVSVVRILHEIEKAIDCPEQLGVMRYLRCEFGDTGYDSTLNGYPNIGHRPAEAVFYNVERVVG